MINWGGGLHIGGEDIRQFMEQFGGDDTSLDPLGRLSLLLDDGDYLEREIQYKLTW